MPSSTGHFPSEELENTRFEVLTDFVRAADGQQLFVAKAAPDSLARLGRVTNDLSAVGVAAADGCGISAMLPINDNEVVGGMRLREEQVGLLIRFFPDART